MPADGFEEADFFRALLESKARVLLIGRRALIALGAPVMTVDCNLWLHMDDVARAATGPSGVTLRFEDAWERRQHLIIHGCQVALPGVADLIVTKRWGSRPKDMVDIQWLIELGLRK